MEAVLTHQEMVAQGASALQVGQVGDAVAFAAGIATFAKDHLGLGLPAVAPRRVEHATTVEAMSHAIQSPCGCLDRRRCWCSR